MKIIDKYILKKYMVTFVFTLLILIPIAVAIDISEKIDNFLEHADLTVDQIIDEYYVNFVIYYANTFMPLALFIAVIFFTSKLSNNTEIIAITNAKVSFTRFLYPYFVGSTLIVFLSLLMNHFIVPNSSTERKGFEKEYINNRSQKRALKSVREFSLQLTDSTYIYIHSFDTENNSGYYFSSEVYDGIELKSKLMADRIRFNKEDSVFTLNTWRQRIVYQNRDSIFSGSKLDTVFDFTPRDLIYKSAFAQEMPSDELIEYIDLSRTRGVKNLNAYLVELHKRTSMPMASYILTVIAVALAFRKRRGGTGVNLAIGIGIMFFYVFLMKIAEVLGAVAGVNSFVYVWMPNLVFGCLAVYLYLNARK
ncbi:LptF/LptG family permease [Polaribacter sp. WD7]|uniref:LptF/LptG family permease n=1 Tax=Polaribacter sp. WD7 TaxID=2269061 RepID=UPI002161B376|nr:LptF/LptG family permease [Polaribacter sp. WD7]